MHEDVGRYERAGVVRTSPMVDSPVLWGNRTIIEIVVPFSLAVGGSVFTKSAWPMLPALALFLYLPRLRQRWGRRRFVHRLWGLGLDRQLEWLLIALRTIGGAGDERLKSLFTEDVVRRFRP